MLLQGGASGPEDARHIASQPRAERAPSAQVIRASASPSLGAGPSIWGLKEGDGGEGAPEGGSSAIEGTENRKREAPRGSCSESVSSLVAGSLLLASPGGAGEKLRLVQMPCAKPSETGLWRVEPHSGPQVALHSVPCWTRGRGEGVGGLGAGGSRDTGKEGYRPTRSASLRAL